MTAHTTATPSPQVPRLARGRCFVGVEHFGCVNTGRRVAIYRAKFVDVYVVGYELEVDRAVKFGRAVDQILAGKRVIRWSEPGGGKRNGTKYEVYAFKSRAAAVAKFQAMNARVVAWNAAERERHDAYRDAVRRGDIVMIEALR